MRVAVISASAIALVIVSCGEFESGGGSSSGENSNNDAGTDTGVVSGKSPGALSVNVEGDKHMLVVGKANTLKVTITRREGYEGPVIVSLVGAPADIEAPSMTLDASQTVADFKITPKKTMKQGELSNASVEATNAAKDVKATTLLKAFVRGAPGDLDTTFATNGVLTIPVANDGHAYGLAPDGAIYVAHREFLRRFTKDGAVDATFAGTGSVNMGAAQPARAVVATSAGVYVVRSNTKPWVERWLHAGTIDTSFGGGTGKYIVQSADADVFGFALNPNGRSAIGASASSSSYSQVFWMSAAGTTDTTVNAQGVSNTVKFRAGVWGVGKLTAVWDGSIIRLIVPDGSNDPSFTSRTVEPGVTLNDIVQDSNSGFIVTGPHTSGKLFLARLNADGSTDGTFANGMSAFAVQTSRLNIGAGLYYAAGRLKLQADGKILQGAQVDAGGVYRCTVVRYLSNGQPDPAFGENGRATPAVDGCAVQDISQQADGKIVIGSTIPYDSITNKPLGTALVTRLWGD